MRITLSVMVVATSLMLAGVAHADMSALDPEHFLDPHEQDTLALIASDLAAAGQAEIVAVFPQEPEVAAAVEVAPAGDGDMQAAAVEPAAEARETEVAAAPEAAVESLKVEATGALPLPVVTDTQPPSFEDESD